MKTVWCSEFNQLTSNRILNLIATQPCAACVSSTHFRPLPRPWKQSSSSPFTMQILCNCFRLQSLSPRHQLEERMSPARLRDSISRSNCILNGAETNQPPSSKILHLNLHIILCSMPHQLNVIHFPPSWKQISRNVFVATVSGWNVLAWRPLLEETMSTAPSLCTPMHSAQVPNGPVGSRNKPANQPTTSSEQKFKPKSSHNSVMGSVSHQHNFIRLPPT